MFHCLAAAANNLAVVLDFSNPNRTAPAFAVPPGPFGTACGLPGPLNLENSGLLTLAQQYGWNLGGLRLP